jgi:energy-coupling factor transporter ATP-binding protein EcfA2
MAFDRTNNNSNSNSNNAQPLFETNLWERVNDSNSDENVIIASHDGMGGTEFSKRGVVVVDGKIYALLTPLKNLGNSKPNDYPDKPTWVFYVYQMQNRQTKEVVNLFDLLEDSDEDLMIRHRVLERYNQLRNREEKKRPHIYKPGTDYSDVK